MLKYVLKPGRVSGGAMSSRMTSSGFGSCVPQAVTPMQLNGRPRETLGWRTPAEALAEVLSRAAGGGAMTA